MSNGGGNFRQPNFQNMPQGVHAGPASLDGYSINALHKMSDQLGRLIQLQEQPIQIVQEVPSDVGGTLSGEAVIGTTLGREANQGWTTIASIKGQQPRYRSVFLSRGNDKLYDASTAVLGVVAKMHFTSQDNAQYTILFDIPANGIVHAACVSQNVDLQVMVTRVNFTETEFNALPANYFDNPLADKIDATHSINSNGQPIAKIACMASITADQALAPNPFNSATRHVSVVLDGGGSVNIPLVRGAVAVTVLGPADLTSSFNEEVAFNAATPVPFANGSTTLIPDGTTSIGVASTTGGLVVALFTLGF